MPAVPRPVAANVIFEARDILSVCGDQHTIEGIFLGNGKDSLCEDGVVESKAQTGVGFIGDYIDSGDGRQNADRPAGGHSLHGRITSSTTSALSVLLSPRP